MLQPTASAVKLLVMQLLQKPTEVRVFIWARGRGGGMGRWGEGGDSEDREEEGYEYPI